MKIYILFNVMVLLAFAYSRKKSFRKFRFSGVKGEFTCANGQTIVRQRFCNGLKNCDDHSDEITVTSALNAVTPALNKQIRKKPFSTNPNISCNNALNNIQKNCLLPRNEYCDGSLVCGVSQCNVLCPNYYTCPDTGICKDRSTICTEEKCKDCPGMSVWNNGVGFKCIRDGETCGLPQFLIYDGVQDCDDGSDLCYLTHEPGSTLHNDPRDIRTMEGARFNKSICFECLDGSLIISRKHVCNGVIDCPDLSDECLCEGEQLSACKQIITTQSSSHTPTNMTTIVNCTYGNVKCPNGQCITRDKLCDGVIDCDDQFDETYEFCHGTKPCSETETPGNRCRCDMSDCNKAIGVFCNGVADCPPPGDMFQWKFPPGRPPDECNSHCNAENTTTSTTMPTTTISSLTNQSKSSAPGEFRCSNSGRTTSRITRFLNLKCFNKIGGKIKKVPWNASQLCDGHVDCPFSRSTDEMNKKCTQRYSCASGNLINIPKSQVCDGYIDCTDSQDEEHSSCSKHKRYYCSALDGAKVSIAKKQICDFVINCDDMSDEKNCTDNRFYCENQQPLFIARRKVFNGLKDCSDWSDECPSNQINSDVFLSSRFDLIANPVLRALVWVMALLAIFGNLSVLVQQVVNLKQTNNSAAMRANHLLVLNLAVSDILMGIYLITLGSYGVAYSGNYCSHDLTWRSGNICNIMGVLVVLSSETSVLTMVILTSFRLYVVHKPFEASNHPGLALVLILMICTWTATTLIAVLPLTTNFQSSFTTTALVSDLPFFRSIKVNFEETKSYISSLPQFEQEYQNWTSKDRNQFENTINEMTSWQQFVDVFQRRKEIIDSNSMTHFRVIRNFGYYSVSSVCIPKLFVTTADRAWKYSFSINLFNFVAFIYVAVAYSIVYAKSTSNQIRSDKNKVSKAMQRKILRLVMTDFCCWVPISIMAFLNIGGVQLPGLAYAVSAIILLPINSALNPIIYSNMLDKVYDFITCKRNGHPMTSSTRATSTKSVS